MGRVVHLESTVNTMPQAVMWGFTGALLKRHKKQDSDSHKVHNALACNMIETFYNCILQAHVHVMLTDSFHAGMISSNLELHRYATGRDSRVVTAMTMLKSHLFR